MTNQSLSKFSCANCSKPNEQAFLGQIGQLLFCNDCLSVRKPCQFCAEFYPIKDLVFHTDCEIYCKKCYEELDKCSNCNNLAVCETVDESTLCPACVDFTTTKCDKCGNPSSNTKHIEDDNNSDYYDCYLCSLCHSKYLDKILPKKCANGYLGDRCFGIELEFNDVYTDNSNWERVEDGSLDCGDGEFLSGPIRGIDAIRNITDNCSKISGEITKNCGFHIHIDFTKENTESAKRFLACAIALEDFIFSVVPPSRRRNSYCVRYNKDEKKKILNGLFVESLKKLVYGYEDTDTTDKYHHKRYMWVNMHSYFYRGTVEIRVHNGTKSPNKILRWAELWTKLADWSSKKTSGFIINKINSDKNFDNYILKSIGLRKSTKEYFKRRQELFKQSDD